MEFKGIASAWNHYVWKLISEVRWIPDGMFVEVSVRHGGCRASVTRLEMLS